MVDERRYWEENIILLVLLFTTYTIIKDFVDECLLPPISVLGDTLSSLIYSAILIIILFKWFKYQLNKLKKDESNTLKSEERI